MEKNLKLTHVNISNGLSTFISVNIVDSYMYILYLTAAMQKVLIENEAMGKIVDKYLCTKDEMVRKAQET